MKRKKRRQRCESCGKLKHDVVKSIDPYQADVNNIEIEVKWCDDCYQNACNDI